MEFAESHEEKLGHCEWRRGETWVDRGVIDCGGGLGGRREVGGARRSGGARAVGGVGKSGVMADATISL